MAESDSTAMLLYVDDDPTMEPLVRKALARPHWTVEFLTTGQQAVDRLKSQKAHLLITDLVMPEMGGMELTEHVSTQYSDIPVVILTGQGTESSAVECFRAGAADYVTKANMMADLAQVVAKLLAEEEEIQRDYPTESSSPSEPAPRTHEANPSTNNEEGEYLRLKWGTSLKSINSELSEETEFTPEKLRVLRRQAERLSKWNKLDPAISAMRKHKRFHFADIVFILPLDDAEQPLFSRRFISFCCNLSAGGCSLIHSRLLRIQEFVIFFPRLAQTGNNASALRAKIVRDRPLSMGMYELGVKFLDISRLAAEDTAILLAAHRTPVENTR